MVVCFQNPDAKNVESDKQTGSGARKQPDKAVPNDLPAKDKSLVIESTQKTEKITEVCCDFCAIITVNPYEKFQEEVFSKKTWKICAYSLIWNSL